MSGNALKVVAESTDILPVANTESSQTNTASRTLRLVLALVAAIGGWMAVAKPGAAATASRLLVRQGPEMVAANGQTVVGTAVLQIPTTRRLAVVTWRVDGHIPRLASVRGGRATLTMGETGQDVTVAPGRHTVTATISAVRQRRIVASGIIVLAAAVLPVAAPLLTGPSTAIAVAAPPAIVDPTPEVAPTTTVAAHTQSPSALVAAPPTTTPAPFVGAPPTTAPAIHPVAAAPVAARVSWERGVGMAHWSRDDYAAPAFGTDLDAVKHMGATEVSLVPTEYIDGIHSNGPITADYWSTMQIGPLEAGINAAHARGLHVLLKPHLDTRDGQPHGLMDPADPTVWFANYRTFILKYADAASRTGAEGMVVGAEIDQTVIKYPVQWRTLIAEIRTHFLGKLTYSSEIGTYDRIHIWDALDTIGLDAYYSVASNSGTATKQQMLNNWAPIINTLRAYSQRWGRQISFTEVGYRSIIHAGFEPYSYDRPTTRDDNAQAVAYDALNTAFANQSFLAGMNIWMWDVAGTDDTLGYTPHNKPAEGVISGWWGGAP